MWMCRSGADRRARGRSVTLRDTYNPDHSQLRLRRRFIWIVRYFAQLHHVQKLLDRLVIGQLLPQDEASLQRRGDRAVAHHLFDVKVEVGALKQLTRKFEAGRAAVPIARGTSATGSGSEIPDDSTSTWSKRRSAASAVREVSKSSRRVQQMQPFIT